MAASTTTITLGTLVARIGLLSDGKLVSVLTGLSVMSGGRFIAGLGTGDRASRPENLAFGVPYEEAAARRARMAAVAEAVSAEGIPVWIGGGAPEATGVARQVGAAVNLWGAGSPRVAQAIATGLDVTWGGPVGESPAAVTGQLLEMAEAGAVWAVCAWPSSLDVVAEAAAAVRRAR